MKKLLLILIMLFSFTSVIRAQDDENEGEKIRDRMREYIQTQLDVNKSEAERFTPIFIRYFREWRSTLREFRADRLVLQQKIVELRLRYRPEFRVILGEQRGAQVFRHQDMFIEILKGINRERNQNRQLPKRRMQGLRTD